jgi:hypothetical protein
MVSENRTTKFIEHMLRHSVRLVRNATAVFDQPEATGVASGIILERPHAVVMLTAGHSFWKPGDWTLETNVVVEQETLSLRLPELQELARIDVASGTAEMIDVAWCRIDLKRVRNVLTRINQGQSTLMFNTYRGPLNTEPDMHAAYGYAAWNRGWLDANLRKFVLEPSFEIGMKYAGRFGDDLLTFELARPHQGDAYYSGASGSAIAAEDGTVVSVLLRGDKSKNLLYGLDLKKYAPLLDAATR